MRIMEASAAEGRRAVGAEEYQGQLHVVVHCVVRSPHLSVFMGGILASLINAPFKICVSHGQQLQRSTPGPYL